MRAVLLSDVAISVTRDQEKTLLRHMIDRGCIDMCKAVDLLYGHDEDGGPLSAEKNVSVKMCCLRAKLRPGWAIPRYPSTRIGGWRLIQITYMDMAA